jgi:hypothetical protein
MLRGALALGKSYRVQTPEWEASLPAAGPYLGEPCRIALTV